MQLYIYGAQRDGRVLGADLAQDHIELTGSAWANQDFLLVHAWLTLECEGRRWSGCADQAAAFVDAYVDSYLANRC